MTTRHDELNRRNLLNLCQALSRYVEAGGQLGIETAHGNDPTENRIILTVPDWTAFRAAMEPGTTVGDEGAP